MQNNENRDDVLFDFNNEKSENNNIQQEDIHTDNGDFMISFSSKENDETIEEHKTEDYSENENETKENENLEEDEEASALAAEISETYELNNSEQIKSNPIPKATSVGLEGLSYGNYLKEMRLRCNLSTKEIADETKISEKYIQSLEEEDLDTLPPIAYIIGYVRKICTVYGVSTDQIATLTSELRSELECELPSDMNKTIVDRASSEENEKKLRNIKIIFFVIILLILVGLGFLGAFLWQKYFSNKSENSSSSAIVEQGGKTELNNENIVVIMPPTKLETIVLE